jgi:O-antigen ligase
VVLTFSRAGFITLAVIGAAYVWKLRRRPERRYLWAVLALALVALPLLPGGYTSRLMTVVSTESDPTGSAQARRDDTFAAMGWVARNPVVGAGLGQDILALNLERGALWRPVHNVYLQYAVDLGLPGLAAFGLLFAACLRSAARAERLWTGRPAAHLAAAIQVSLIAFGVAALFHPSAYHFYFYYVAGLAVAVRLIAEGQRAPAHA